MADQIIRVLDDAFPARAGMNRIEPRGHGVEAHAFPARAGMNRCRMSEALVEHAFPARAGMNRLRNEPIATPDRRVPRTRGDEPTDGTSRRLGPRGVPRTRGDEPLPCNHQTRNVQRVPRTRGDEPRMVGACAASTASCSPHARG